MLNKCLSNRKQFAYIVRTQSERKEGVFKQAFEKVQMNEFIDKKFEWDNELLFFEGEIVGWCIALSEYQKIKKKSFPLIDYMIFDEYMVERGSTTRYISGWNEPDIFLSLYHTIDRDDDRVKCFLLGNNSTFYNPYHVHKAFNVQPVKKGEIWTNKNVLYQWATATDFVKTKKQQSKFSQMLINTEYGKFANEGEYIEDTEGFIAKHEGTAKYSFTVIINGLKFGIYYDIIKGLAYLSEKVDNSCPIIYALTLEDQTENVLITKNKTVHLIRFAKCVEQGLLRYESMLIKKMCEKVIYTLM